MSRSLHRLVVLAALVTSLASLAGCGRRHAAKSQASLDELPAARVRVAVATANSRALIEEITGTTRARRQAHLEAKVSGRIELFPVLPGQQVKAGELLARLDAAEFKARLDQAAAAFGQAERDWKRVTSLFEQQAVTRAEYEAAEARHSAARAAIAEAKAMNSYLEVTAPFDGWITMKQAHVGDLAFPGKPLLVIEDRSVMEFEADLPEAIAHRVVLGAILPIRVEGVNEELPGKVTEMAGAADPVSRTVRFKLELPAMPGLISGRFGRLAAPIGESRSLCVPTGAVLQRGQLEIAFVVTDQRAYLRLVRTGKLFHDTVEVLAGLEPGEVVVVEGAGQLKDGQLVEVQ